MGLVDQYSSLQVRKVQMGDLQLSVVATLFKSETYISEFLKRISESSVQAGFKDYEIILVNDGSPDRSLELAVNSIKDYPNLVVLDLSRNFGHHQAMVTGLKRAKGGLVFLIDSDLEEEPELLLKFQNELRKSNADMVFGVQAKRRGTYTERTLGSLFYKTFRTLTGINQPDNILTARLMTSRFVSSFLLHPEREINLGGLWELTGYKQVAVPVVKASTSPTTYSLRLKIRHFTNAITSFSSTPLVFGFYLGLISLVTCLAFISYQLVFSLITSTRPDGYLSIIISIWFFSGLILCVQGIQGIYLSKVFTEVKQRPLSIVRREYDHSNINGNESSETF